MYTIESIIINLVEVQDEWRKCLVEFLNDPSKPVSYHLWKKALDYCLLNEQLYKRIVEEVLLKCLEPEEALIVLRAKPTKAYVVCI